MNKRFAKVALACGLVAACAFGMAACSGGGGKVAATVNGNKIYEKTITDYIQSLRESYDLMDDEAWSMYLAMYGMDVSDLRSDIIESYVSDEVKKLAVKDQGLKADKAEIDAMVEDMRSNYTTDSEWATALKQAGYESEDKYREALEEHLLEEQLEESVAADVKVSDKELLKYCNDNASFLDGAKRSSHILFDADDKATAKKVLGQLQNGQLDFAAAAKKYSTDAGSAEDGGDVGWDAVTSFVEAYTDALDKLDKGQMSGLVTSEYGIHIIKCTNVFNAPSKVTKLDQIPKDLRNYLKEMLQQENRSTAIEDWLTEYREGLDIVINDMPSGLPYDVASADEEADGEDGEATDEAADENAGEEAEAESK